MFRCQPTNRPKIPTIHDPCNPGWYYDYNRYFNEAEKYMDFLESKLSKLAPRIYPYNITDEKDTKT